MRLIDADKLEYREGVFPLEDKDGEVYPLHAFAVTRGDINEAPTIDAVTVVRCRDCNRAQEVEVFPGIKAQYTIACPLYHNRIFADEHYCAWGERKDDG